MSRMSENYIFGKTAKYHQKVIFCSFSDFIGSGHKNAFLTFLIYTFEAIHCLDKLIKFSEDVDIGIFSHYKASYLKFRASLNSVHDCYGNYGICISCHIG